MTDTKITKDEFLARCANAYDCGLATPELMNLLTRWLDAMMRLEHSLFTFSGQSQFHYVWEFFENERARLKIENNDYSQTLAGDVDGYKLIQFAAILNHHCQACATDPHAWWTRSAFCSHKREESNHTCTTDDYCDVCGHIYYNCLCSHDEED